MSLRRHLPARRYTLRGRADWTVGGAAAGFYVDVGFDPADGAPLEIFLRARSGKNGSMLSFIGDDLGETLSLLLQHGYSLAELAERFKPSSLAGFAVAQAAALAESDLARRGVPSGEPG